MGRPWDNGLAKGWCGRLGVTCARKSQHRAQRCAARLNKLCMRLRHACVRRQVSREQEGLRAYAELQRKHRAAYGDNEEAREAAGKAALLRAKALHSPGWAARLRCEERGRLAAASVRRLRGKKLRRPRTRGVWGVPGPRERGSGGPARVWRLGLWRQRQRATPSSSELAAGCC